MKKVIVLLFAVLAIGLSGCDKDLCQEDGATQTGTAPCGDNGFYQQVCTQGVWVDDLNTCVEDICVIDETCETGPWIDDGRCTCPEKLIAYGMGPGQTEYVTAASREYDWYMDQAGTGQYSGVNCGPTSVTMAIKWADGSFALTPEDARKTFRAEGGWWYTNDITKYLNLYNINNYTFKVDGDENRITQEIDNGKILIFCIDASQLTYNPINTEHVDSFYNNVTGHFIVGKGYTVIDDILYIEVYDPYSMNRAYPDSSKLKGKNRYLRWDTELETAVEKWWNYAIAVDPASTRMSYMMNEGRVDEKDVVHKPGGISSSN